MTILTTKIVSKKDIKKMITNGVTSFKGKAKKYPLINSKTNKLLVLKIELKKQNDSGLYAVIHTAAGNKQNDYDKRESAKRQVFKYRKLKKLKFPKIRNKEAKLIIDIVIVTGIRPGGQSTNSKGLLDLTGGNIKRKGKFAVLDFLGKRQVAQKIKLSEELSTRLFNHIDSIEKLRKEKIFTYKSYQINKLLKKTNLKDLRTKIANDISQIYLAKLKKLPANKKEYKDAVTNLCSMVAKQLGHFKGNGEFNISTSKKSYIAPENFQYLSSEIKNPLTLLTKKEKEIHKLGSKWERMLLPVKL